MLSISSIEEAALVIMKIAREEETILENGDTGEITLENGVSGEITLEIEETGEITPRVKSGGATTLKSGVRDGTILSGRVATTQSIGKSGATTQTGRVATTLSIGENGATTQTGRDATILTGNGAITPGKDAIALVDARIGATVLTGRVVVTIPITISLGSIRPNSNFGVADKITMVSVTILTPIILAMALTIRETILPLTMLFSLRRSQLGQTLLSPLTSNLRFKLITLILKLTS
jgi:hypothetical protein